MRKLIVNAEARYAVFCAALAAAVMSVVLGMGTEDTNLGTTITSITTYFDSNVSYVVAAFVLLAMLFWFLRILFRSLGIHSPNKVG